jgi:hypothetical protein
MNPRNSPTDDDESRQNSTATSSDVGNGVHQQPTAPPPTSRSLPRIEPEPQEPPDPIHVGAAGKLIVPYEDLLDDFDDGTEMDLVSGQTKKIRRPDRREWIVLNRESEFHARLLNHKPKADGIDVEHYHVDPSLRRPISDELKGVRVFVFYSLRSKSFGLWIVNVTVDNTWYDSLAQLFKRPAEFFARTAIRVISDKPTSRYRIKLKPLTTEVTWPATATNELLGEALGRERFITSADHPLYRDLVDGTELT